MLARSDWKSSLYWQIGERLQNGEQQWKSPARWESVKVSKKLNRDSLLEKFEFHQANSLWRIEPNLANFEPEILGEEFQKSEWHCGQRFRWSEFFQVPKLPNLTERIRGMQGMGILAESRFWQREKVLDPTEPSSLFSLLEWNSKNSSDTAFRCLPENSSPKILHGGEIVFTSWRRFCPASFDEQCSLNILCNTVRISHSGLLTGLCTEWTAL